MFSAKLMSRALVACGFVCVFAAFALPAARVECHAIDYDPGIDPALVCDGGCPGTEVCQPRSHAASGTTFCACRDGESLPVCCELAESGGAPTVVGDCPSCPASGECRLRPVAPGPGVWKHYEAACVTGGGGGG